MKFAALPIAVKLLAAQGAAIACGWLLAVSGVAVLQMLPSGGDDDLQIGLILGVGFAQVSVAAAWLALGSGSLPGRMAVAGLLALNATVGMVIAIGFFERRIEVEATLGIVGGALAQFALLQAPFWLLRAGYGLRLTIGEAAPAGPADRQFSLAQMLLWMTAVAVLLGVGRALVELLPWVGRPSGRAYDQMARMAILFGMIVVFDLLLTWPAMWALLTRGGLVLKLLVAVGTAVAATAVEYPLVASVLGQGGDGLIFWVLNGAQYACLALHLLVARGFSCRLRMAA